MDSTETRERYTAERDDIMNRAMKNAAIRGIIAATVLSNGTYNTRAAISALSAAFGVPKQVVAGNISWLVRSGQLSIRRCPPNSALY